MSCPVKSECSKAKYGKGIQRSEYQEYINNNKDRIEQNKDYYRRRQAIVEHPYGTIKRQWSFDHIMTKQTMERASADRRNPKTAEGAGKGHEKPALQQIYRNH